jgi:hypothetical protein
MEQAQLSVSAMQPDSTRTQTSGKASLCMGMMATATRQPVYGALPSDASQAAVTWQTQIRVVLHKLCGAHTLRKGFSSKTLCMEGLTRLLLELTSSAMPTPLASASHIT